MYCEKLRKASLDCDWLNHVGRGYVLCIASRPPRGGSLPGGVAGRMVSALNVATVMVRSTGDSGCTIQELAGLVWNKCTTIFESARACCSYEMWYDCKWLECSRPMAVLASPTVRAVRTACFAEQMEQKKQLLLASSQKSYPPAFHSLILVNRLKFDGI